MQEPPRGFQAARQEPRPPNALVIVLERRQLQLLIESWATLSKAVQQQIMLLEQWEVN